MGYGQSKEDTQNIAIAQVTTLSGQVDAKLNYVGIGLIVVGIIMSVIICYGVRAKCRRIATSWVRKAVEKLPPTTVRVESTQRPQAEY